MMNFLNREEKFALELARDLEPLRGIPLDYHASERLQELDTELATKGRHLIESNDRYQAGAAFLTAAHDHYTLADTIRTAITDVDAPRDYRGTGYDRRTVVDFVAQGYYTAKKHFQTAETILTETGYRADERAKDAIRHAGSISLPPVVSVSRRFVEAAADAVTRLAGQTDLRQYEILQSPLIGESLQQYHRAEMEPLLGRLTLRTTNISRVTGNGSLTAYPEQYMPEVATETQGALDTLHALGMLMAYPELKAAILMVDSPLREYRPGEHVPVHFKDMKTKPLGSAVGPAQRPEHAEALKPAEPLIMQPLEEIPVKQPDEPFTSTLTSEPLQVVPLETEPLSTVPLRTEKLSAEPLSTEPLRAEPLSSIPLRAEPLQSMPLAPERLRSEPFESEELSGHDDQPESYGFNPNNVVPFD
jgi:hypothetical protein